MRWHGVHGSRMSKRMLMKNLWRWRRAISSGDQPINGIRRRQHRPLENVSAKALLGLKLCRGRAWRMPTAERACAMARAVVHSRRSAATCRRRAHVRKVMRKWRNVLRHALAGTRRHQEIVGMAPSRNQYYYRSLLARIIGGSSCRPRRLASAGNAETCLITRAGGREAKRYAFEKLGRLLCLNAYSEISPTANVCRVLLAKIGGSICMCWL